MASLMGMAHGTTIADFGNDWNDFAFTPASSGVDDSWRYSIIDKSGSYDTGKGTTIASPDGNPYGMILGGDPDPSNRSVPALSFTAPDASVLRVDIAINFTDYLPWFNDGVNAWLVDGSGVSTTFFSRSIADVGDYGVLNWTPFEIVIAPGKWNLYVDAFNVADTGLPPEVFVSNISLTPQSLPTPIPSPGTLVLMGIGLLAISSFNSRRRPTNTT